MNQSLHYCPNFGDHFKQQPEGYQRSRVPDAQVSWKQTFKGYTPPDFTLHRDKPFDVDESEKITDWHTGARESFEDSSYKIAVYKEGKMLLNEDGQPRLVTVADIKKAKQEEGVSYRALNPAGRTGQSGRGRLGRSGPNHAADPLITYTDKETGKKYLLTIRRKDTGQLALPGGMRDPGEKFSNTALRELVEEAMNPKAVKSIENEINTQV